MINLFSPQNPYWIYIPSNTEWNFPEGFYLIVPQTSATFTEELMIIPYHIHSRSALFHPSYAQHFKILHPISPQPLPSDFSYLEIIHPLKTKTNFQEYKKKFDFIKKRIFLGDIYEVNFCMEFYGMLRLRNPVFFFETLHEQIQSPYSVLIRLQNTLLLCFSPELFIRRVGKRLWSQPIKGTLKKSDGMDLSEALVQFRNSEKEMAENAMTVDVARNDFSRIACISSVQTTELFKIRIFKNIIQQYSTVECLVSENTGWYDILGATFPMASMTGAPKVSAVDVIRQTENFQRDYYSGTIGLFRNRQDAVLNVVIRTLEYNLATGQVRFCAGSAITWKSDAWQEFTECESKVESVWKYVEKISCSPPHR